MTHNPEKTIPTGFAEQFEQVATRPAFAGPVASGMTLRTYLAAEFLKARLSNFDPEADISAGGREVMCSEAVDMANALIENLLLSSWKKHEGEA